MSADAAALARILGVLGVLLGVLFVVSTLWYWVAVWRDGRRARRIVACERGGCAYCRPSRHRLGSE